MSVIIKLNDFLLYTMHSDMPFVRIFSVNLSAKHKLDITFIHFFTGKTIKIQRE